MGSGLAVSLVPTNLHWLTEPPDDKADLCAHSAVEFFIGGEALVSANEGDWTVSASAVYLLRTLSSSHTKATPVGDHLFPCCGHTMYAMDDQEDVYISGCPNGKDFEVLHEGDAVVIRCDDGRSWVVSSGAWRDAVCSFSDSVRSFYARSAPRQPSDEFEAQGFRRMIAEWDRRREQARHPERMS